MTQRILLLLLFKLVGYFLIPQNWFTSCWGFPPVMTAQSGFTFCGYESAAWWAGCVVGPVLTFFTEQSLISYSCLHWLHPEKWWETSGTSLPTLIITAELLPPFLWHVDICISVYFGACANVKLMLGGKIHACLVFFLRLEWLFLCCRQGQRGLKGSPVSSKPDFSPEIIACQ